MWALRPIRKPLLPRVRNFAWARNPIDAFVLNKLESKGMVPAPPLGKRELLRRAYFDLTRAFWNGYAGEVRFRAPAELQARGIEHLAVCLLARIDGTSPVDYLPEEPKREAVRRLGRTLLRERPTEWETVLDLCDKEMSHLSDNEPGGRG